MSITDQINAMKANATLLFSLDDINQAVDKMAEDITEVLADKNPVIIGVMIGALIPFANLVMRLDFPLEMDYVHATRYQGEIEGTDLHWKVKPSKNLKDRVVLIVDDILDGGVTLAAIVDEIKSLGAAKIYTAVLVDKFENRQANGLQQADFVGLDVSNHFVFGYGLDYKDYLRNAPGIYQLSPEFIATLS